MVEFLKKRKVKLKWKQNENSTAKMSIFSQEKKGGICDVCKFGFQKHDLILFINFD